MNLYSIDVTVYATAYIKAENEAEAKKKLLELASASVEAAECEEGEVPISGKRFEDPDLPDISLSPAMTVASREVLEDVSEDDFDLAEENIDVETANG